MILFSIFIFLRRGTLRCTSTVCLKRDWRSSLRWNWLYYSVYGTNKWDQETSWQWFIWCQFSGWIPRPATWSYRNVLCSEQWLKFNRIPCEITTHECKRGISLKSFLQVSLSSFLQVAITRAKRQFFLVASSRSLKSNPGYGFNVHP
jgi:hypothetical protein